MRVFVVLVLVFSFVQSKTDVNVSNEIFLRLDTKSHNALIRDIIITKDKKYFIRLLRTQKKY